VFKKIAAGSPHSWFGVGMGGRSGARYSVEKNGKRVAVIEPDGGGTYMQNVTFVVRQWDAKKNDYKRDGRAFLVLGGGSFKKSKEMATKFFAAHATEQVDRESTTTSSTTRCVLAEAFSGPGQMSRTNGNASDGYNHHGVYRDDRNTTALLVEEPEAGVEPTDAEKDAEKEEKIGFNIKNVQDYYDAQLVIGATPAVALAKTKKQFKVRALKVSPAGRILAPDIPKGKPIEPLLPPDDGGGQDEPADTGAGGAPSDGGDAGAEQ